MGTRNKIGSVGTVGFGIGAIAKDMVYMLSASYIQYYFLNIIGVQAFALGIILVAARIFDALNDPIMGIITAKTKGRFGRFKPWIIIGTITNAVVLYVMFNCPLSGKNLQSDLIMFAAVTYVLWGVTYTMMDIPFWSMVPAFTDAGKEREGMAWIGRSFAGIGSAIVSASTVAAVNYFGRLSDGTVDERAGYGKVALVVAVVFVILIIIMCALIKENSAENVEVSHVSEMLSDLVRNDQAMAVVISTIFVNTALYITSNCMIYFFQFDFQSKQWSTAYSIFTLSGGVFQILAMFLLFPLLRRKMSVKKLFSMNLWMAIIGYLVLLVLSLTGTLNNQYIIMIPTFLIMAAMGMYNINNTILLANSVDYAELKNDHRHESVVFSMQTLAVKVGSGISGLFSTFLVAYFGMNTPSKNLEAVKIAGQTRYQLSASNATIFELAISVIPIILLVIGYIIFAAKYKLDDQMLEDINLELQERRQMKGEQLND